jgi:hypothetical protein
MAANNETRQKAQWVRGRRYQPLFEDRDAAAIFNLALAEFWQPKTG